MSCTIFKIDCNLSLPRHYFSLRDSISDFATRPDSLRQYPVSRDNSSDNFFSFVAIGPRSTNIILHPANLPIDPFQDVQKYPMSRDVLRRSQRLALLSINTSQRSEGCGCNSTICEFNVLLLLLPISGHIQLATALPFIIIYRRVTVPSPVGITDRFHDCPYE